MPTQSFKYLETISVLIVHHRMFQIFIFIIIFLIVLKFNALNIPKDALITILILFSIFIFYEKKNNVKILIIKYLQTK